MTYHAQLNRFSTAAESGDVNNTMGLSYTLKGCYSCWRSPSQANLGHQNSDIINT